MQEWSQSVAWLTTLNSCTSAHLAPACAHHCMHTAPGRGYTDALAFRHTPAGTVAAFLLSGWGQTTHLCDTAWFVGAGELRGARSGGGDDKMESEEEWMGNGCSSVGERGVVRMVGMVGTVGTVGRCDRTLHWAGLGWPIVGELWVLGGWCWLGTLGEWSLWLAAGCRRTQAGSWLAGFQGRPKGQRGARVWNVWACGIRRTVPASEQEAQGTASHGPILGCILAQSTLQLTRARSRPLPDPACSLNSRCHSRNFVITATWTPPPYGPPSLSAHSLTLARHDATADADQSCWYLRSSPVATTTNPLTTMVSFRPL